MLIRMMSNKRLKNDAEMSVDGASFNSDDLKENLNGDSSLGILATYH